MCSNCNKRIKIEEMKNVKIIAKLHKIFFNIKQSTINSCNFEFTNNELSKELH